MILSETAGKWMMRLYPPLFFNRVWVKRFYNDYRDCELKLNRSLLNMNMNGTIFGGSIFSSIDPFYAVMFWQIFARKKVKVQTWLKSAHIQYLKPAGTDLFVHFHLDENEVNDAETSLNATGKFIRTYTIEIKNKHGEICAIAQTEVYIRKASEEQETLSGF
jgi:acyl-coenzyme A thioesterase PaaI-like protein